MLRLCSAALWLTSGTLDLDADESASTEATRTGVPAAATAAPLHIPADASPDEVWKHVMDYSAAEVEYTDDASYWAEVFARRKMVLEGLNRLLGFPSLRDDRRTAAIALKLEALWRLTDLSEGRERADYRDQLRMFAEKWSDHESDRIRRECLMMRAFVLTPEDVKPAKRIISDVDAYFSDRKAAISDYALALRVGWGLEQLDDK